VLSPANMSSSEFAAAQARLAARRQARTAEAQQAANAVTESASHLCERISATQSPGLRRAQDSVAALWGGLSSRDGTRPAFRVSQVDAELLDEDLVDQLRGQVGEALRYLGGHGRNLGEEWGDEILLVLRAALFKLSVWDHDATYGATLQNLKYTDARHRGPVLVSPSRWQKSIYGLVSVGGRYAWTKWETWLLDQDSGPEPPSLLIERLSRLTSSVSTAYASAALVSFLVFLLQGRYRTVLDRILRIRLAPPTSQVSREVSFEYLNRQLVWHAFTEFLLFLLPLAGIHRWRRWLTRFWRKTKTIVDQGSGGLLGGAGDEKTGELAFLPERTCAICYQDQNAGATEADVMAVAAASSGVVGSAATDVTNPYEAVPCGHVYCYVCLVSRIELEDGEGWACLRCGELVKECKPWDGDVLEPRAASPGGKTVGFV
jgi:peroxin-2